MDISAEITDHGLIVAITELDMIEPYIAANVFGGYRIGHRGFFLFFSKKFKHPLGGSCHGLQHIGHLRNLLNGIGKVAHILNKRLDITDGDDILNRQECTGNRHRYIAKVAHKHHDRLHHTRQELRFPCGIVQHLIDFVKLITYRLFAMEHLNHHVTAVNFFHLAVDVSQIILLRAEVFLRLFDDNADQ